MKAQKSYFTTKTAIGGTFCNREIEREQLKRNIEKGEHTVVVAPRRYGKTSLVCQTLKELKVDHAKIDLFCAVYATTICEKITKGVSELVKKVMPFSTKTLKFLEGCFKHVNIVLKASSVELQVNFANIKQDPYEQIIDVLKGLEKIAKHKKKRVVVFIDEFQDLLKADHSEQIQAAIRSVAQHCQYVSFIFSGSSRNMLRQIFEDRNQPLYMLCQKIYLKKITASDLTLHMQKQAKKRWKKLLPEKVVGRILQSSECHPYYVNLLCDKLWDSSTLPALKEVDRVWQLCFLEQTDKLIADLEPLNTTRLKVLSIIALQDGVAEPNGKAFLDQTGLALGTVQKGLQFLLGNDFIYRDDVSKKIELVDPLLKVFIQRQDKA